jgi:tetratricopeptide (TPR) repeat protein
MDTNIGTAGGGNSGDILREVLALAHPIFAQAIFVAAVPHWYDLSLFTAIRDIDDNRNKGLIPRLQQLSFVIGLSADPDPRYRVRNRERLALHRMWIDRDVDAYSEAHRRAFVYIDSLPVTDDPTNNFERLYHHFFIDLPAGTSELIRLFQRYAAERRLGAIEYLLEGVDEAYELLRYMSGGSDEDNDAAPPLSKPPQPTANLIYFAQLRTYLRASLLEMRGRRTDSKELLLQLRRTPSLVVELRPYLGRAFASLLRSEGKFVEAIDELETAIQGFEDAERETQIVLRRSSKLESAITKLALGNTYVEFACSVRGESRRSSVQVGLGRRLQSITEFITSAPLIIYLSFHLGRRVWHPDFWMSLFNLDWIVARLFVLGAKQYQAAAPTLHDLGAPEEKVLADEGAAGLFLEMGDVKQAYHRFTDLLTERIAPLGPYRRLRMRLSLAETQVELQQSQAAQPALKEIIPKLEAYADAQSVARAYALLAEAALRNQDYTEMQRALGEAVSRYYKLESLGTIERIAEATNVQERIEALAMLLAAPHDVRAAIDTNGERLRERRYTVGYQHPAYVTFRRVMLFLLPLALVLVYLTAIQLETEIGLAPAFAFRAAPILNREDTQAENLSQGITATRLDIDFDPESLLPLTLGALLLYLTLFAALGVWIIQTAPLHHVQERTRAATLAVYAYGIGMGDCTRQDVISWEDIRRVVLADTAIWHRPLVDASSATIHAADHNRVPSATAAENLRRMTISGATNWYLYLIPRLRRRFPENVNVHNLNQSIFYSVSGAVYLLSVIMFLLIAFFAGNRTWGQQLWTDLAWTSYSVADLYPYLYLGLVLLPMWWAIARPIQISRYVGGQMATSLFWLVIGGIVAAFLVGRSFRPLLTVPDLYPPLFIIVTIGAAVWLLWHVSTQKTRADFVRLGAATLAAALICVAMLSFLARDIYAYHLLITGNTERDRGREAMQSRQYDAASRLFSAALAHYDQAITISGSPFWIVQPINAFNNTLGLPSPKQFTWVLALKNAAALHAQEGDGGRAVELYTQLMEQTGESDQLLSWRAIARQRAATQVSDENGQGIRITSADWYRKSLEDYQSAIELLQKNANLSLDQQHDLQLRHAQYVLWRGFTSHSLDKPADARTDYSSVLNLTDQTNFAATVAYTETIAPKLRERAMSGVGWLAYDEARKADADQKLDGFEQAAIWFEQAVQQNPDQPEAWLGLGYAKYSAGTLLGGDNTKAMDAYAAAQAAWTQAAKLDPSDPVVHISLGTLHWKLANFVDSPEIKCQKYTEAIRLHRDAVDTTRMRHQHDADIAHSYRTIGRIYFLLGNCRQAASESYAPKEAVFQSAIDSFSAAVKLDSSKSEYYQVRGRYAYALWKIQTERDYGLLYMARDDLNRAAAMGAPANQYLKATLTELVPHAAEQAARYLEDGNLQDLLLPLEVLATSDIEAAEEIRDRLRRLLKDPEPILLKNPDLDRVEALQQIQKILDELVAAAPSTWFFERGLEAVTDTQPDIATSFFEIGLSKVQTQADLTSAQDMLIKVSALRVEPQARMAIIAEYRRALPQLEETVQADPTVYSLVTLGTIAAVSGDMDRAGRLYAQAILLNNDDHNAQYDLLRHAQEPLMIHWHSSGSTATALLAAFDEQLDAQVAAVPTLEMAEYYLGVRAWFKYWLGRSAFRAGDETAARAILDSAQEDADHASARETWEGTKTIAHLYIREAAWAWYHIERGDDQRSRGDYASALVDYQTALRENHADKDNTARNERITALQRIADAHINLGDIAKCVTTYQELLLLTSTYNDQDKAIHAGIELQNYLLAHPEVDIGAIHNAFVAATPEEAILARHSNEADYWRHRAEFELNVAYRVFLDRVSDDDTVLAIVQQAVADAQQAAKLDSKHAARSEFAAHGWVAWVYRQRGDQELNRRKYGWAYADYQAAVEHAQPQDAESTQIMLDAMLRAGIAAMHLKHTMQATVWFTTAVTLYNRQADRVSLDSIVKTVQSLLASFDTENPEIIELRDQTLSTLDALLNE